MAKARVRSTGRLLFTLLAAEAAKPVIGGQAVLEGVMMRSPKSFAVAVRRPDGAIVVREEAWLSFSERLPFLKWPLLRGATMLVESLWNGMSALSFSAEVAMEAEEKRLADEKRASGAPVDDGPDQKASTPASTKAALAFTLVTSLVLAIALFKGVPHAATWGLGLLFGSGGASALPVDGVLFHLVDGTIKLAIFAGYIIAIGRLPDVKRLFMYHGAEHMSVHSYEARAPLDVENTRPRSTAHPRCGTTLILLVISLSILVFVAVIPLLPRFSDSDVVHTLFTFVVKVPLMLPIAGLAYEGQRYAARNPGSFLARFVVAPGMLMQRLTTRQPGDPELEVALAALTKALWREQQRDVPLARTATVEVFPDLGELAKAHQLAA